MARSATAGATAIKTLRLIDRAAVPCATSGCRESLQARSGPEQVHFHDTNSGRRRFHSKTLHQHFPAL